MKNNYLFITMLMAINFISNIYGIISMNAREAKGNIDNCY